MGKEKTWEDYIRLVDAFAAEPTLENYLALRRKYERMGVDSSHLITPDPLSAIEGELRLHKIDPAVLSDALDGNEYQIDELCLQLMERLVDRQNREKSGKTHLQTTGQAIPDSLIDYLLISMLETSELHGLAPQPALVILIRERLGGPNPAPHKQNLIDQNRKQAVLMAASQLSQGKHISIRQIAKRMRIEASTVSRWFKTGELTREANQVCGWFKMPRDLNRKAK